MKATIFCSIILLNLAFGTTSYSQTESTADCDSLNPYSKDAMVYWYFVGVKFDKKTNERKLKLMSRNLTWGTIEKYELDVWRKMQSRLKIPQGPFLEENEAKDSYLIYNHVIENTTPVFVKTDSIFYWTKLTYRSSKRKYGLVFDRTNHGIIKGSKEDFYNELKEPKHRILLGPFRDSTYLYETRPRKKMQTNCHD